MPLKDRVVSTAKAEVSGVSALAEQSVRSRAWLYPIKGAIHFATHRQLWGPIKAKIVPLMTLSLGVISTMFIFTYIPQSFLLTFVNGPLAFISTIALVLSESAAIITALSRNFLLDDALLDVFDAVLVSRGCEKLVSAGRELRSGGNSPVSRLGKTLKKPFSKLSPDAIISYFIWLPLNFIPVIGTVAFIIVQGRKQAPGYHARYFQLKGWGDKEKGRWIEEQKPAYTAFGTVAMLCGMVPVVGVIPATVGAALWAADLEGKKGAENIQLNGMNGSNRKENGELKRAYSEVVKNTDSDDDSREKEL